MFKNCENFAHCDHHSSLEKVYEKSENLIWIKHFCRVTLFWTLNMIICLWDFLCICILCFKLNQNIHFSDSLYDFLKLYFEVNFLYHHSHSCDVRVWKGGTCRVRWRQTVWFRTEGMATREKESSKVGSGMTGARNV